MCGGREYVEGVSVCVCVLWVHVCEVCVCCFPANPLKKDMDSRMEMNITVVREV